MHYDEFRRRDRRRRKKRQIMTIAVIAAIVVFFAIIIGVCISSLKGDDSDDDGQEVSTEVTQAPKEDKEEKKEEPTATPEPEFEIHGLEDAKKFPKSVVSTNGILIDAKDGRIIAQRASAVKISPASMTKILTVLVAAENIDNLESKLNDKFKITAEITDYSFVHECSNAGFSIDEKVTVQDLFYGTILPSGADAAVGLATYVAGSHENFVKLMNAKLKELGIDKTTHFTNCVGLYDENHYSTAHDMAVILKAASENEFCKKVLSERKYTTSKTKQNKDGLLISNWFLRRIEDKDTHGEVVCAKTGFVNQSGSCAASLATDTAGNEYICVTTGSESSWRCIYDHIDIYQKYLK